MTTLLDPLGFPMIIVFPIILIVSEVPIELIEFTFKALLTITLSCCIVKVDSVGGIVTGIFADVPIRSHWSLTGTFTY